METKIADVAKFDDEIEAARAAHESWRLKLEAALLMGTCEQSVEDIASPMYCAFGTWLRGRQMTDAIRATKPYQVVARLHREFHNCAARVVSCIERDDRAGARALLDGEFADITDRLDRALRKWQREAAEARRRA